MKKIFCPLTERRVPLENATKGGVHGRKSVPICPLTGKGCTKCVLL